MSPDTVRAIWNGPFEADLGPGLPSLKPGDEFDVSPELANSAHWTVVDQSTPSWTAHGSSVGNRGEVDE